MSDLEEQRCCNLFHIAMEKKIERLRVRSRLLGESFSEFDCRVFEILTVLSHREMREGNPASPEDGVRVKK